MSPQVLYDGAPLKVQGYANLYDVEAITESGIEVFRPGAFMAHLERGVQNVIATWDHSPAHAWASVKDGTLRLWEDSTVGLAFEATIVSTPFGLGLANYIAGGHAGASVLFHPLTRLKTAGGQEIMCAYLKDICICTSPAYPTAVWLSGQAQPETLTPYARDLREKWIARHEAHWVARIERLRRYCALASPSPRRPPATETADWCEQPAGFSREEWLAFGAACAHGARANQRAERWQKLKERG